MKQIDSNLPKELALIFNRSAEGVAGKVRAKINSKTGRAARTVKAARTQKGAVVRAGGKSVPYYGPLDFGGYPKGRPFIPEGRYLYPTAEAEGPKAVREVEDGMRDLIRRSGL
ncbi:MAG TPA: hypothetical protein VK988_03105 [Acidimicrobiales bacterium]|nr:hypothetical protein [Acidimicrobiales bacterium]